MVIFNQIHLFILFSMIKVSFLIKTKVKILQVQSVEYLLTMHYEVQKYYTSFPLWSLAINVILSPGAHPMSGR